MVGALYSINRPHTDNIKSGRKLWEIRKSKPNIPVPFPAFIYETKKKGGCGKVIGEFVCDEIITISYIESGWLRRTFKTDKPIKIKEICLTPSELDKYAFNNKGILELPTLYGLHISNLKIYDTPKEINEFKKAGFMTEEEWLFNLYPNTHCHYEAWVKKFNIDRPPQSMCYVEM